MKRIYASTAIAALSLLLTAAPAFGLDVDPVVASEGVNISTIVSFVINAAFFLAAILALFYLIWGGINWITSGGDSEAVGNARSKIIAAIIGLIIVVLAYFVLDFVLQLLGACGINELQVPSLTGTTAVSGCPEAPTGGGGAGGTFE